ncbi:GNAT family N-acetyltransferase [Niabella sp. CC-SYL272]|uniref:GNAT family N-acetyltransferase n=1 Tax=Niabella agricola TaxID=2891571 RepID=UPI001F2BEC71|nr:GNAT family N-acetyltransferase [Niabella agricola]MCF3107794.1 GNAT family N-acetyltransferase [Niabella agricola]
MKQITIERAAPGDVPRLQRIGRETFAETFAASNTEENMRKYLEEGFSAAKLTGELENSHCEFYFALLDQQVIGYLKLNTGSAQTEIKDNKSLEIERIYVLQAFLGKKVGQLLYDKALQVAKDKGLEYLWLGVWEENRRAIRFYEKNGFVAFDKHIFRLGNEEQTDIMMKKMLSGNLKM